MKLGTIDAKHLKAIVEMVKKSSKQTEIPLRFDKAGLKIQCIDPARIAVIMLDIGKSDFSAYHVKESIDLMLELDDLMSKFKVIKTGDVALSYDKKGSQFVLECGQLITDMPLLTYDKEVKPMPDLDLPLVAKVDRDEFVIGITAVSLVSNMIRLKNEKDNLVLFYNAERRGSRYTIPLSDGAADEEYESQFDLNMIEDAVKSFAASEMTVKWGKDVPMMIDWTMFENSSGLFMLAPRVDAE